MQKFRRSSRGKDELAQCTMGLSIALRISKITKKKSRKVTDCLKIQGKYLCSTFVENVVLVDKKHERGDYQS